MKPRLPNSPTKLASLSVVGSLIASIIFVDPWPRRNGWLLDVSVLLGAVLFAVGVALSLRSTSNLKHGIENQDWPESQIEPLRNQLESPWCTALSIALLIAFAAFQFIFQRSLRGEGWACFLLAQTISRLHIAVRNPRPGKPSGSIPAWRDYLAPIHSDHWGSR